jgi:DNA-damage-inducible protein J
MVANAVVRSRITADIKDQAAAVLEDLGLSVSDLMRITLTRVAKGGAIPFDWNPNKLTRETIRKSARREEIHKAKNAEDLFDQLGI